MYLKRISKIVTF